MPLFKYKSLEEANAQLQNLLPQSPVKRMKRIEALIQAFNPPKKIERGVIKFSSFDEANKHRERTSRA